MAQVSNRFAINLNSSTLDSKTSTMSTVQDLNSASSLSWADDEVENLATLKVQHFLDSLDEYLCSGCVPSHLCFDLDEAAQWKEMIANQKLMERLQTSRKHYQHPEEFKIHNSVKKKLEITGHSYVRLQHNKFGNRQTGSGLPAHRTRSAYPLKASSPIKPAASARMSASAARSTFASNRLLSNSTKAKDLHQILHSTARLSLHKDVEGGLPKQGNLQPNFSTGLKRMKLQPHMIPKTETETTLPPLYDPNNISQSLRTPPKTRTPFKNQIPSQMNSHHKTLLSQNNSKQLNDEDHFFRKPASAALHRNSSATRSGLYYRHANNPAYRTEQSDIHVGVIGTSFDPVVRPIRINNKFRSTLNS